MEASGAILILGELFLLLGELLGEKFGERLRKLAGTALRELCNRFRALAETGFFGRAFFRPSAQPV